MTAPLQRLGICPLPLGCDGKRAKRKGRMDIQLPITSQKRLKGHILQVLCALVSCYQNVEYIGARAYGSPFCS